MSVLVTGACGFMGSNFVRFLYRKYPGYRIHNLDALTYAGNPENLADIEAAEVQLPPEARRYTFVKGDVCDVVLLDNLFKERSFDLIVHFAAESHVDRSIFNVADFIRTNIEGTRYVMEAARRHHVPKFVHISTDEVYGDVREGFATEEAPFRPSNPYSASKAGADFLIQAFMKTFAIPALIVRSSNNYGPFQYPEKLIPLAISNLLENKKIPVHGTGKHVRSWLHVEDFCAAVDLVAHKAPVHSIYNISGEAKTNLEVLTLIARHLGKDLDEFTEHIQDRPCADHRYAVDGSKLEKELKWSRQKKFDTSIGEVAEWYLTHRNWWQKIKLEREFQDHYTKQSKAQWY